MKKCPFCAEEIQDAAIVCKHCGRDLQPQNTESVQRVVTQSDKKNPAIGGLGLFLFVIGIVIAACGGQAGGTFGLIMGGIGLIILIYALSTGNIKMFG